MRIIFPIFTILQSANSQEWSCSEKRETVSGKTCQRWDTDFPHRIDAGPSAPWHNLCCKSYGEQGAHWCYTTDPESEREDCTEDDNQSTTRTQSCDCWEYSKAYDGKKDTTKSGKECVNWQSVQNAIPLPEGSWNHNYCRNPDFHHGGPWCYTNKYSTTWEECGVDHCSICDASQEVVNTDGEEIVNENIECGTVERDPSMNLVQGDHRIDEFSRQGTRGRENAQNRSMLQPNPPNTTSADFQAILSGRNAMRKTLPWQVLIKGKNICGGTLISAKHVISAAHCFQDHDETYAYGIISAGHISRTRSSLSPEPERQERNFGKYIPHRSYNPSTNSNDICIIVTDRPFRFNEFVRPACLPEFKAKRNAGCIVSGFGSEEFGGTMSDRLLMQVVEVRSRTFCKNQLHNPNQFDNSMLCAGGIEGVDSCTGDSGGPLVCHANGKYTLYGVVSFGYGCGAAMPGVYADAFALRKWIKANMQ